MILRSLSTAHQFGTSALRSLFNETAGFSVFSQKRLHLFALSLELCLFNFPLSLHTACPRVSFFYEFLFFVVFWGCSNRRSDDSLHPFLPFHLFRPIWGRCTISTASLFHSLLSLHSSVPPSFSLVLSISLSLSKGRSTKSNNGKKWHK